MTRQTFWPVKFSPHLFFLKSYLSYSKKLVSIKKKYPWPPRGTWGGYKGVRPPKRKNPVSSHIFGEKKVSFSFRIIWDINTKPHSSKKLEVNSFLVHFWTKNCNKQLTFKWQKKFASQWIFYFIAKIHYFRPFF